MGIWDKLAFWKKDDDFGLNSLDTDFTKSFQDNTAQGQNPYAGNQYTEQNQFGQYNQYNSQQSFNQGFSQNPLEVNPVHQQTASQGSDKEMELINAKLDAIRSMLESINQRLANVERIAKAEEDSSRRKNTW